MNTKFKFTSLILGCLFCFVLVSCLDDESITGKFPETPVNFEAVNSEFDDYNSASPYEIYNEFPLIFSSNRKSEGQEFDFVSYIATYYFLQSNNKAVFDASDYTYYYYDSLLYKVNSEGNELGPHILLDMSNYNYVFLYSSDKSGNQDIYYAKGVNDINPYWNNPVALDKINTSFNELYPSLNKTADKLYFCSDAEQQFDIYYVPVSGSISRWFETEEEIIPTSVELLNSPADDKCPYLNGDLLVFTSNREGGYGGFDLYYSVFENGNWSSPVNFGPTINSEYDEYRPIVMYDPFYSNNVMIFSSNRPGGKGGFDLYYVGISKMI